MSGMVQDTIGDDDDTSGTLLEVHVPCVSADILDLVVQYCTYFLVQEKMKAIPQPITSGEMGDMVQTWYANFCDTHHSILFDMIRASDYMGIKPLLDLVSAKVATLLFRKPPDEIRKGLGLVDGDFTPAEEKMVREENHWCDHLGFK